MGSLKNGESKPLGIKWPSEPIKALGVFFTYDHKLSHSKNSSEKIVDIKKTNQYLLLKGAFCLPKGYSNQITYYTKDHLHPIFVTYSGTHCQGFKSHIIYVFYGKVKIK